jgi:hypothetical protein
LKKALKILVIALLLIVTVIPAQAQRRVVHYLPKYEQEPYHFGFLLAFNDMMYTIKTVEDYQNVRQSPTPEIDQYILGDYKCVENIYVYNVETRKEPGFTVGIIGSKRLGRYFDLRFIPSLSFGCRYLYYSIKLEYKEEYYETYGKSEMKSLGTKSHGINTVFVEFPLNIKYRSKRYNNIGAYLMAGVNPKLDLGSRKKKTIERGLGTKRFDFASEIGVGFDFYNQWFKMGVEIKMSYGMLDIIDYTPSNNAPLFTGPIDKLSNKMFQISMLFE